MYVWVLCVGVVCVGGVDGCVARAEFVCECGGRCRVGMIYVWVLCVWVSVVGVVSILGFASLWW